MEWIVTKHIKSTDGLTEKTWCELFLEFPVSDGEWNKKTRRPVIELFFYDYKHKSGWWVDILRTKWYNRDPHKRCEINFKYFQSHPKKILYTSKKDEYINFTLEYCQGQALNIFQDRLENIIKQINH